MTGVLVSCLQTLKRTIKYCLSFLVAGDMRDIQLPIILQRRSLLACKIATDAADSGP